MTLDTVGRILDQEAVSQPAIKSSVTKQQAQQLWMEPNRPVPTRHYYLKLGGGLGRGEDLLMRKGS